MTEHVYIFEKGAEKAKTLVVMHGTGGNERDLLPLAHSIAPGWNILSVRGRVLEKGMPRFFRRLAEGVFDHDDMVARAHELANFLHSAQHEYDCDPRHLVALGYSNGANMATNLLLLHPDILAGAALLRPMTTINPSPETALQDKKILILSGAMDAIAPPEHGQKLRDMYTVHGADVTYDELPATHLLGQYDIHALRNWIKGF